MAEKERDFKILVVDDEQNIRDGAARILTRMGHGVAKASNGKDALSYLKDNKVDIMLLDLKMPGMDGLEVVDIVRESDPEILIIIVTGFATIETAIDAMKKGTYNFLTKPFRPDQLRIVVDKAVEHIRLKEERDRLSAEREKGLWAITKEKTRLKTVVNSMSEGIMITGTDKRIVMCNPAFTQLMGLNHAEITGSTIDKFSELNQLNEMADRLIESEEEKTFVITNEFEIPGDRTKYVIATINKVEVEEEGSMLGLVAFIEDITHIKELEKEKSAFVAMLTHELRAPIGAVDTQLHVILKGLAGELSEKQRDMFTRIRDRIKNVIMMVNELLDLSKIEARQFVQEKVSINLNSIIE